MPSANALLQDLPVFSGELTLVKDRQTTKDIVKCILDCHEQFAGAYDAICMQFAANTDYQIAKNIYNFLRANVINNEETEDAQTIRTPSAMIATGRTIGADCKNYAVFAGGVLAALNRRGYNIDWCYRFAGYAYGSKAMGHVFVVINPGGDEIWIDPIDYMRSFDNHSNPPVYFEDKKTENMALYIMSGVNQDAAPVYKTPYGEYHIPVKADGNTTIEAMAHGVLLSNLENALKNEMDAGLIIEGDERYKRAQTAISNLLVKIACFETEPDYNFGAAISERMNGGLISAIYGSDQLQTFQKALPAMAIRYLYLWLPVNDDPAFYTRWVPLMSHDYKGILPAIVIQKRNWAGQTAWHIGEWAGISPDTDIFPLMYSVVSKQMGMTPEAFWQSRLGLPITPNDNGVFSGLMSATKDDPGPLADELNQTVSTEVTALEQTWYGAIALGIAKTLFGGVINKVEMLYPLDKFTPAADDWVGSKWQPFPNGFPPSVGVFGSKDTGGSVIDNTNPNNPVPGGGNNSGVWLLGAAAAAIYMYKKKHG